MPNHSIQPGGFCHFCQSVYGHVQRANRNYTRSSKEDHDPPFNETICSAQCGGQQENENAAHFVLASVTGRDTR